MAHSGDSVIVASSGALRTAVPYGSVWRVQTSEGKSRGAGAIKGAKVGAILSGGMGLAMGMAIASGDDSGVSSDMVLAGAGLYAVSGAMWGLAIGAIVGAEKWTTVYQQPLRLTATVTRSGTPGLGLSRAF